MISFKIDNGLKLSVDLNTSKIIAYVAKKNTPVLNFSKINSHKINDFWNTIIEALKSKDIKNLNLQVMPKFKKKRSSKIGIF